MSNTTESGIFSDIIGYYSAFSPENVNHIQSVNPMVGSLLRHYHRPNLEKNLYGISVVTVHHDLTDDDPSLTVENFLDRYREADRVICLNSLQQRYLEAEGITHSVVIPHGYNDRFITRRDQSGNSAFETGRGSGADGRIVIGMVSRRYPRKVKGEGFVYELLQRMDPRHFELVLIGRGRTYDAAVLERYGYHVTAYESVPYRTVAAAYGQMDALLMASWHEGGPANIPEAVAAGVPVICNPIGMAYDMITDELNGLHLTMDPGVDADRISAWLTAPEALCKLRAGARQASSRAIPWSEHVARVVEVYRSVIQTNVGAF